MSTKVIRATAIQKADTDGSWKEVGAAWNSYRGAPATGHRVTVNISLGNVRRPFLWQLSPCVRPLEGFGAGIMNLRSWRIVGSGGCGFVFRINGLI
ncbi:hypothetical protein [Rhizobium sullae]|uniref:Uncharacterized protein n=1 Tax=Rhizobium sullae TaxID=50338 RepID=A0A4R3Q631_RHISU|nr:hypothetical protein [Rhizobium sullae]TCU15964.1 hypothetical protein EV132_106307 [Rhizobium sullae]